VRFILMKIRTQRWLAFQYTLSGFGERETFISTLRAEQPFLPCTQHPFFESAMGDYNDMRQGSSRGGIHVLQKSLQNQSVY
jgi:hypothetical protein